jgi:hypothetical protein
MLLFHVGAGLCPECSPTTLQTGTWPMEAAGGCTACRLPPVARKLLRQKRLNWRAQIA